MNALSDIQFRRVCAGPSLLLSAPHDPMFTRTNYTSGIPSLSVTNVRNVLEFCDNRARREKRHGKMFPCHADGP